MAEADDVEQDRRLQAKVTEGEESATTLGELRYRKCVVEGLDYAVWADKVGVDRSSVHESVTRHARRAGLPVNVGVPQQSRPRTERNPKGAKPKLDKAKRTRQMAAAAAKRKKARRRNYRKAA